LEVASLDKVHSNFAKIYGVKNRIRGLLCGVVCVMLRTALLTQFRLVTDRETGASTDGQTEGHNVYR